MLNESILNEMDNLEYSSSQAINGKTLADMLGMGDIYDQSKAAEEKAMLDEAKNDFFAKLEKLNSK